MSNKISIHIMMLMAMFLLSAPAWSAPRDKQVMLQLVLFYNLYLVKDLMTVVLE